MIRASQHYILNDANRLKCRQYHDFINEFRRVACVIVDHIWEHGYSWAAESEKSPMVFDPIHDRIDIPRFLDYKNFHVTTTLSARALSSLCTQLCGVLKASVEKYRRKLYVRNKYGSSDSINKAIAHNIPVKPDVSALNPELSSKCCDFKDTSGNFMGFLRLKSLGIFPGFNLPIRNHRHSMFLSTRGTRMTSFCLCTDHITVRWNIPDVPEKVSGDIVGIDQGVKTIITVSDGQIPQDGDWTLDAVLTLLSRKRKGSKACKRAQDLRKNVINRNINQLNLGHIKEVRFEKITNIFYKHRTSKKLRGFTNTLIRDKVQKLCAENGVRFVEQSCTYRSQRCSVCGMVHKANRKAKQYICNHCGSTMDADLNAACNHEQDLPDIPYALRKSGMNLGGFFWKPDGFFTLDGQELESLLPQQETTGDNV